MPNRPHGIYQYRAFFKPKALDVFAGFATDVEEGKASLGYTQAWHKANWDFSPYAVYNELICGEIGRFLRLPIPPFAITYRTADAGEEPIFSSLDFNFSFAKLPAVIPDICVEQLPLLSAGVVAFDILIANEDRHDANLLVNNTLNPTLMYVWDHEQALLGGGGHHVGIERLDALRDRLGITGSPVTGGNSHCLRPFLTNYSHLRHWLIKISEIPAWFINSVCDEARHYGLDRTLADAAALFLHHRICTIDDIVNRHRDGFPRMVWPIPDADSQGSLFQP